MFEITSLENKCPICNEDYNLGANLSNNNFTRKPKDATICFNCAQILIFADDLSLREPNPGELKQMDSEQPGFLDQLYAMQRVVRDLDRREPPVRAPKTTPQAPSPFSKHNPKLQLAWDSTSLGAFKACPRLYQLSILEGWSSPYNRVELDFGIWLHKALELYDKARNENKTHDEALCVALRYAINATWDFERKRPWLSDEPTRSRNTLFRTIVWYLDTFENDTIKTVVLPNGKAAVEVSFRFGLSDYGQDNLFMNDFGEEYMLCGHIDKIGEWNGKKWIRDIKSTKYELDDTYFRQYSPDNQVSLYDIAGLVVLSEEVEGLIIDAAQILVSGTRFRRKPIPRSPTQREEWLRDLSLWLAQAETYANIDYWPMNERSCGYGRRQCQFRPICSADPEAREDLLNAHYVRRDRWNPLETR